MEKSARFLVQWALLLTVAFGCSGNNTGATCNATAPCGGTLDGTWQMDGTCVEGNLPAYLAAIPGSPLSPCSQIQTATAAMAGTATFANGMETDDLTVAFDVGVLYTSACVDATNGTTVTLDATGCSILEQTLLSHQFISSSACSLAGGNCVCSVTLQARPTTTPQAYGISGTKVVYANGGSPLDYCVSGATLTTRDVEQHATFFNTAHKL